jgi:hypothetical protein
MSLRYNASANRPTESTERVGQPRSEDDKCNLGASKSQTKRKAEGLVLGLGCNGIPRLTRIPWGGASSDDANSFEALRRSPA